MEKLKVHYGKSEHSYASPRFEAEILTKRWVREPGLSAPIYEIMIAGSSIPGSIELVRAADELIVKEGIAVVDALKVYIDIRGIEFHRDPHIWENVRSASIEETVQYVIDMEQEVYRIAKGANEHPNEMYPGLWPRETWLESNNWAIGVAWMTRERVLERLQREGREDLVQSLKPELREYYV